MLKYSWILLLALIFFVSCDKEGEVIDNGYSQHQINIVYPETSSSSDLTVTFNGEELIGNIFPGRDVKTGVLKVSYKDYTPLEKEITLYPSETIQILLLPSKTIELYEEERFIKFNCSLILNDGCTAILNNQPLLNGLNYIAKEKATGNIEFYTESNDIPIATIENVGIEENSNLNIMQLNERTFIEVPEDNEPLPASNKILKARFLYMGDEILSMDEIKVDFYILNEWSYMFITDPVASITLQKGQLSDYIELDCSFRGSDEMAGDMEDAYGYSFLYEITDPANNTVLVDHNTYATYLDLSGSLSLDGGMTWAYQKTTFVFSDGGNASELQKGLSIPWEQQ